MLDEQQMSRDVSRRAVIRLGAAGATVAGASLMTATTASAANTTYYVAATGSDSASGTTQTSPWRTLSKVNSMTFGPGDRILFRAGDTFQGVLAPKGSGASGAPIVFGRYGTGPRPHLAGAGAVPATVQITTSNHLTITGLEITNTSSSPAYRSGIFIDTPAAGLTNISLTHLSIHDISGVAYWGQSDYPIWACGGITVTSPGATTVNNLLIENVDITNVDDHGIRTTGVSQGGRGNNIVIRYVNVTNAGGNGILLGNATNSRVEHCTVRNSGTRSSASAGIWPVYTDNSVIQYNGVWRHTSPGNDGFNFNCDWQNSNALFQYNYSQDGQKGFFQAFFQSSAIVRYNVSQNDWSGFAFYGASGMNVYNNTIFLNDQSNGSVMRSFPDQGRTPSGNVLSNNIIWNRATGAYESLGVTYNRNLFHGNHPASEPTGGAKLVGDPLLTSPGVGSSWAASGYRLRAGSPALGAGVNIANNGGKDYFANSVSGSGLPHIGAYNGPAV